MTFDAIVLGSGHNSLILAAYLARSGMEVICLEAQSVAGGGLATTERPEGSGFLHNTHSFFHRGVTHLPWYRDLCLEQFGALYLEPELNVAVVSEQNQTLHWWREFDKTLESFAAISPQDADTLARWRGDFLPIVNHIIEPELQSPPLPPSVRQDILNQSKMGQLLLHTSALSPIEFVKREFEHPFVQASLLFFNGLREVDLRCQGFGHHVPALLASSRMAQMCVGGSRRLADALVTAVENAGGSIQLDTTPRCILVEHGRVAGVETTDGQFIRARKLVASGLNPQQTFLDLIDKQYLPSSWIQRASSYQYNVVAPLFSCNVNLKAAPVYQNGPEVGRALMVALGVNDLASFDAIVRHHQAGTIPPTVMWGSCPTQFDASQAPAGKHTAFMWEKLPFRLHGDSRNWDQHRRQHADQMLTVWQHYAPNLGDSLLESFCASPLDTERKLTNMRFGDLLVGSLDHGQLGYHRPFPGAGHYRGHLEGLYLCGSCCHPGGNITGLPGYNCAQIIYSDFGLPAFWPGPSIERRLLGLGT